MRYEGSDHATSTSHMWDGYITMEMLAQQSSFFEWNPKLQLCRSQTFTGRAKLLFLVVLVWLIIFLSICFLYFLHIHEQEATNDGSFLANKQLTVLPSLHWPPHPPPWDPPPCLNVFGLCHLSCWLISHAWQSFGGWFVDGKGGGRGNSQALVVLAAGTLAVVGLGGTNFFGTAFAWILTYLLATVSPCPGTQRHVRKTATLVVIV